ncbi:TetR/AcrR family transcriptional regulator [Bacillus thuringiensis]|uniref:TetR/AcrR family transcriptional regulator n=1 Tax=Bacillus cereus TaxID=1396 RepID=A0AAN5XLY9_BACCE|nr:MULTISPECIES: TetR/AcrR family transcriptional regulator [Bacillus]KAB2447509.1 TetR/AcrR family transcriptional regulator [Bacillus cereus]KAB2486751.1 TetR/AcrR family transcriptional regulator [Bacillus cereus]MBJ8127150.1 TetR/AcrR family transcriptional regulator [Bacillus cereus]MCU4712395.1 TetR/AcrR family transcriptional regulator [Bacillus cereus]MCU5489779.1 TetR/AcrR family transcriptional regulator [Bacillus cereus]
MSTSKKEDPRTLRSREMFKNAVYSLLQEESTISNLTVQKIANEAGLNRTTFYLHYQDIQDLLMQLTDEISNELSNKITALIHVSNLSEKQQLTQLLDYLYIHRNYLSVLFNMNHFEEQLFLLIKKLVETRRNNSETELPEDYVAIEIKTASLVGIIMWWIKNGLHFSSDYITNQIYFMYRGQ